MSPSIFQVVCNQKRAIRYVLFFTAVTKKCFDFVCVKYIILPIVTPKLTKNQRLLFVFHSIWKEQAVADWGEKS